MNTTVKTAEVKKNHHIFDYLAVIIIIAGISLYYTLKINIWLKWGIVSASIILAFVIFYFVSTTGLSLHDYVKESWRELGKVVWPPRKEAIQFTWIVFLFVIVLAIFLWAVDSSLAWLFYSVILGKAS
ncbi:MAG: secE [Burkholderiales bacterium]|jgi:preprotein translocase subunit SecE|nr:secE [Burkholderiales bacterium]